MHPLAHHITGFVINKDKQTFDRKKDGKRDTISAHGTLKPLETKTDLIK